MPSLSSGKARTSSRRSVPERNDSSLSHPSPSSVIELRPFRPQNAAASSEPAPHDDANDVLFWKDTIIVPYEYHHRKVWTNENEYQVRMDTSHALKWIRDDNFTKQAREIQTPVSLLPSRMNSMKQATRSTNSTRWNSCCPTAMSCSRIARQRQVSSHRED